jgi:NADH:ubiquinone oxidoreductase subunit 6 (subunit J)
MEGKKPMSHLLAGLLISVMVIIVSILTMMIAGNAAKPGSGLLTYAIIIGGLILFVNLYGKAKNSNVTFGELFSYGFKSTAVYTVIFIGFLIIFSLVVPDFKSTAIEATRVQMETGSGVSEQQAEQSIAIMENYFWVFAIGGTTLLFVIIGAIGSLIGAAVTKKNPQPPFDQSLS